MGLTNNRFLDPFDNYSWVAILCSISSLTLTLLSATKLHQVMNSSQILPQLDLQAIFLRFIFGITEPDRIRIVHSASFATGNILKNL